MQCISQWQALRFFHGGLVDGIVRSSMDAWIKINCCGRISQPAIHRKHKLSEIHWLEHDIWRNICTRKSGSRRRRPAAERQAVTLEVQKTYICGFLSCNVETIAIRENTFQCDLSVCNLCPKIYLKSWTQIVNVTCGEARTCNAKTTSSWFTCNVTRRSLSSRHSPSFNSACSWR